MAKRIKRRGRPKGFRGTMATFPYRVLFTIGGRRMEDRFTTLTQAQMFSRKLRRQGATNVRIIKAR